MGMRNLQEMHISEREYQFVDQVQGREKTERHFGWIEGAWFDLCPEFFFLEATILT